MQQANAEEANHSVVILLYDRYASTIPAYLSQRLMKPFDDLLPEEMEPAQHDLLAALQRVSRQPASADPAEQEQLVARVRERLLRADQEGRLKEEVSLPRRRATIPRFLNSLAAVLAVAALIGASLLLFAHRPLASTTIGASAGDFGPVGTPATVPTERGGLAASMRLTPGPYFLSELIAVDFSLTNYTLTTFSLQGVPVATPCDPALFTQMAGGGPPHYTLPVHQFIDCPFSMTELKPGRAITIRQYVTLTDSGQVTLTEGARFLTTKVDTSGNQFTTNGPSPLDGYWPAASVAVSAHIPPDRELSFRQEGARVIVSAPPWAQSHLLYLYNISCQDFQGPGGTGSGDVDWRPLSTNAVSEPGCPGKISSGPLPSAPLATRLFQEAIPLLLSGLYCTLRWDFLCLRGFFLLNPRLLALSQTSDDQQQPDEEPENHRKIGQKVRVIHQAMCEGRHHACGQT